MTPMPPKAELPPLATYAQKRYDPPRWTTDPALWVRDRLSGLVDWQWSCVGPRSIDPAHCRLNLFHYNPKMADDIRKVWEQRSGLTFDPWADLASIIGTLDNIRGRRDPNAAMWSIEAALKEAVSALS